jgi:DNA-binding CsgD family transcriptional regulator
MKAYCVLAVCIGSLAPSIGSPEVGSNRAGGHPPQLLAITAVFPVAHPRGLRQWHSLGVYAEYFRFFEVEDRLQVRLPAPPAQTKVVGLDRSGDRDFDERERLLLNLLQAHLSGLDAAARERRLAAALLLEREGAGRVVLRSSDQIDYVTPAAEGLLARYFDCTSDGRVPETVRAWLRHDSRRLNGDGLPAPSTAPLTVDHGDRRLTVRRAGNTLLLDEEIGTLTHREREIVDELAAGRSNAEIAERLAIAPTTVRKHLENIYAKLGVNTRTGAIAATRTEIDFRAHVDLSETRLSPATAERVDARSTGEYPSAEETRTEISSTTRSGQDSQAAQTADNHF